MHPFLCLLEEGIHKQCPSLGRRGWPQAFHCITRSLESFISAPLLNCCMMIGYIADFEVVIIFFCFIGLLGLSEDVNIIFLTFFTLISFYLFLLGVKLEHLCRAALCTAQHECWPLEVANCYHEHCVYGKPAW